MSTMLEQKPLTVAQRANKANEEAAKAAAEAIVDAAVPDAVDPTGMERWRADYREMTPAEMAVGPNTTDGPAAGDVERGAREIKGGWGGSVGAGDGEGRGCGSAGARRLAAGVRQARARRLAASRRAGPDTG